MSSRKDFEAWGCSDRDLSITLKCETYAGIAWLAWQAATNAMEAKCAALAAENAALKASEREFDKMCAEEFGPDWVSEFTETPATDAYLAEVRASGVDMLYASRAAQWPDDLLAELNEFADQLRQGGAE